MLIIYIIEHTQCYNTTIGFSLHDHEGYHLAHSQGLFSSSGCTRFSMAHLENLPIQVLVDFTVMFFWRSLWILFCCWVTAADSDAGLELKLATLSMEPYAIDFKVLVLASSVKRKSKIPSQTKIHFHTRLCPWQRVSLWCACAMRTPRFSKSGNYSRSAIKKTIALLVYGILYRV